MTKEEKQRGLELQGYIDSIRDMTIKEIAIDYLKKHNLPKLLASMLVKFSHPLLLAKDYELSELEEKLANADYQLEGRDNEIAELKEEIRQLKNEVEDLRGYCNQIGKVKTDVLKAFEHIVAK